MNPDLRHPFGYTFPAGPKAPAPIAPLGPASFYYFKRCKFNLPASIARALQERSSK